MQNIQTTPTTPVNINTTAVSLITPVTTSRTPANKITTVSSVTTPNILTIRTEGLWVRFVSPWQLEDIWQYEAVQKSNTQIVNI